MSNFITFGDHKIRVSSISNVSWSRERDDYSKSCGHSISRMPSRRTWGMPTTYNASVTITVGGKDLVRYYRDDSVAEADFKAIGTWI